MQHTVAATTSCRSFSSPWTFSPLYRVSLRLTLNSQALYFSLLSAKMIDIHQTSTASRSCFPFACWTHLSSYRTSSFQVQSHSYERPYLMSPQSCSLFYILPHSTVLLKQYEFFVTVFSLRLSQGDTRSESIS